MAFQFRAILVLAAAGLPTFASGHYNMLLPESPAARKGTQLGFTYQWGHPFEHQVFDAPEPVEVYVLDPAGKKTAIKPVLLKGPKRRFAFQHSFSQRGDHVFVLQTPPIWMEEDQEFLQDTVKAIVHVQTQKGWDQAAGQGFELVPLTRPYGLQPGMVFQAQAQFNGKPLAGALVEVERYNAVAPKKLPPDEQITRTIKTDPGGTATCTLTEPGWWCITAQRETGKKERGSKSYPVRQRTTLWVYVDEKK